MSESVLHMFSSRSFIVSGLTFRSLIHSVFIFVYGVRKCSSFIVLEVVDQFSQHHLLKRLSFLHCIFLPPLSLIGAWIYLWAFYFVPLIFISVFVPVPYCPDDCGFVVEPEVRQVESSSSIFLSQDCFGYSRYFVQFSSVTQLYLTLCDPMNRSIPGLPVHHQLSEFTQTHVHQVGDAITDSVRGNE